MINNTILVVDDEKDIRDVIEIYLANEGFKVIIAENGEEALKLLQCKDLDLIILDIMMPKLNGIQACINIRKERKMPIIMLSAKSEDADKILGLNIGADDYVTKPFNPLELVARVKSQLRRYTSLNENINAKNGEILIDGLIINILSHEVSVEGKAVKLTPIEFSILELLALNRGIVFSSNHIYEKVWKEPFYNADNTVAVHIRNLRDKTEINPKQPRYIKVVWGVGYKIDK